MGGLAQHLYSWLVDKEGGQGGSLAAVTAAAAGALFCFWSEHVVRPGLTRLFWGACWVRGEVAQLHVCGSQPHGLCVCVATEVLMPGWHILIYLCCNRLSCEGAHTPCQHLRIRGRLCSVSTCHLDVCSTLCGPHGHTLSPHSNRMAASSHFLSRCWQLCRRWCSWCGWWRGGLGRAAARQCAWCRVWVPPAAGSGGPGCTAGCGTQWGGTTGGHAVRCLMLFSKYCTVFTIMC